MGEVLELEVLQVVAGLWLVTGYSAVVLGQTQQRLHLVVEGEQGGAVLKRVGQPRGKLHLETAVALVAL
jgi:hypothetical protein